jgi:hypothetical protein
MTTTSIFSVAEALKSISLSDQTLEAISKDIDFWNTFGKKDSHLLRAKLFKLFRDSKIDHDTIFMVFFFFSVVKNKTRVMESMDNLPEELKALPIVTRAKDFIRDKLVQYVSQESSKNFAVVHLPTTMPGVDLLATAYHTRSTTEAMEKNIFEKQTFTQMHINAELQAINKKAQENFWNNIVTTSKNQARNTKQVSETLKFHEQYYNTSAADKYYLIDHDFKEIKPSDLTNGYTKKEIVAWFNGVKEHQKKKTGKGKSTSTSGTSTPHTTPPSSEHVSTKKPATPPSSGSTSTKPATTPSAADSHKKS